MKTHLLKYRFSDFGPNHANLEHFGGPSNGLEPRDGVRNGTAVGCPVASHSLDAVQFLVPSPPHWKQAIPAAHLGPQANKYRPFPKDCQPLWRSQHLVLSSFSFLHSDNNRHFAHSRHGSTGICASLGRTEPTQQIILETNFCQGSLEEDAPGPHRTEVR